MTKFYKHIVDHQKLILAVFLILFVVCLVCRQFVAVNYDMRDYLPEKSPSTQALNLMDQEYSGGIPNARVMVQNVSAAQALEYKEKLRSVDGVTDVTWLDDVAISLLTVFTFMPALILSTYKLIDKSQHRPFMPSFKGFGRFVSHVMMPLVIVFAILIVPSYLASNVNSFYYGASHIFGSETQLGADTEKIEDAFGQQDTYVLLIPKDSTAIQAELSQALHDIPRVKSILSYVDTVGATIPEQYLDSGTLSKLNSDNYTRMVLTVDAAYEGDETFDLIKTIRETAEEYYPGEWYLAGEGVSTYDLMDTVTADMVKVNLVAIGAVFVVLIFTMKSLILPVILVLSIETAIWINLAIPYFSNQTIFYIAYLIISSIQLGATVDYAILFTDRYREMRQTYTKEEAIVQTVAAVAVSILTSAIVMTVVGFLLGMISTHGLLSQLGYFLGKGALLSLAIVLLVLPGLLYLFDKLIVKSKKSKEILSQ